MLNKNDPLIGAVQEVMKKNQAERDAARLVNEKFGVHDRKALPHEKQGAWDAAYQQVLSEGKIAHPNQQRLDVHEPEKDELTSDDFRKLRAKKKPMEEATDGDTTSPSSMGIKKPDYATGTPDYAKSKEQTVNRAAKTSLPAGTMKEAKSNAYAIGMSAVQKSTGDKPPMEKKNITKAHDIAKKIIARKKMNEGFNDRHDSSVTASAEKQVVAEQVSPMPVSGVKNTSWFSRQSDMQRNTQTASKVARLRAMRKKPTALDTKRNAELDKPGLEKAGVSKAFSGPHGSSKSRQVDKNTKDAFNTVAPFVPGVGAGTAIRDYQQGKQGIGQTAFDVATNLAAGPAVKGTIAAAKYGFNYFKNAIKAKKAVDVGTKATSAATKPAVAATAAAPQTSSQVANKFRYNANKRYNVAGSEAKPPAKVATGPATSGVPSIARTPGNKIGIGLPKAERTGPWNKVGPAAPAVSAATTAVSNTNRISAIRRINRAANKTTNYINKNPKKSFVAGAAVAAGPPVAVGIDAYSRRGLFEPSSAGATPPKKKEITDRVPQTDAKAQGVQLSPSTVAKPSGKTQQPYGMKGPAAKLDPDSRIAKGNVVAPAAVKPPIPKAKPTNTSPAAQAPAVKKPAPVATKPAAPKVAPQDSSTPAQRSQFNRQIDRGNAAPGTKYKGLGVTSGTTVKQKPMAINKNLPGK